MSFALYVCLKIRNVRSPSCRVRSLESRARNRATWSREAVRADHRGGRPRPRGAAGHLPRPARAERRRQVDDDAAAHRPGDRGRGLDLRCSATSCPPRPRRRAPQMGVVPQLDNLDVDVTVEDNLAVFARLYRVQDVRAAVDRGLTLARLDGRRARRGRRALGRDAPPAAAGARPGARPAPAAARRAHRRTRPADPHRAVVADRLAALARARRS